MATVTIGKSYFEALLRRAEFVSRIQDTSCAPGLHGEADFHRQHTSNQHVNYGTDLSNNVTISKAEHEFMSALFRGGLSAETLETLLQGENGATSEAPSIYDYDSEHITARSGAGTGVGNASTRYMQGSDNTAVSYGLQSKACPQSVPRVASYGEHESFMAGPDSPADDDDDDDDDDEKYQEHAQRIPLHDQRTVLITNLSERTTHKDLASIVRGGRLLDIFLRNDRSATISFGEGAAEFLAYAKRNDIYLHMKRLEFRWNDRQFHVPPHVSNKIANGATRNLVVRCIAGKVTADQIRDHLDHIHNLVVVDIYFQKGDAYISTNSVHNALFARTCMMSRTTYKGTRIEYYPDECAEALPRPTKTQNPVSRAPVKPMPVVNQYALLDTGSDDDSQSDEESYMTNGVKVDGYHWADSVVA
ncbi:conserved hypothetical protein [Pyrenophora tritici-repentis Pt-1C-BFP]|uniref:Uncharacterized protein n=1 Tax=Pyrenophora tritici-repentis (strain Pt-1C-BFP) TaxID=426418 RepID=B2WDV4_PYRTR|nr:uncharacterized protein PTRG_08327 [Pyrenophora tritici-repentis Pt-1C-BFP]EDU51246.1 conserved hypothetical protein [Pyrenophora tritici-repentis Pt-1C-BFP]